MAQRLPSGENHNPLMAAAFNGVQFLGVAMVILTIFVALSRPSAGAPTINYVEDFFDGHALPNEVAEQHRGDDEAPRFALRSVFTRD